MDKKFLKRRETEDALNETIGSDILLRRKPLKKQKKIKRKIRLSTADYTFLQYHMVIRAWALRNHNVTDSELNFLQYLYPINIFSKLEFNVIRKQVDVRDRRLFSKLLKKGWLNFWSKSGNKTYYVLSGKANSLISRLHRMYILEEPIPMSSSKNRVANSVQDEDKRLMELFKEFNSKIK